MDLKEQIINNIESIPTRAYLDVYVNFVDDKNPLTFYMDNEVFATKIKNDKDRALILKAIEKTLGEKRDFVVVIGDYDNSPSIKPPTLEEIITLFDGALV